MEEFTGEKIEDKDWSELEIKEVKFEKCTFIGVDFSDCRRTKAVFDTCKFVSCKFGGSYFTSCRLLNCTFKFCTMFGACFDRCKTTGSNFSEIDFSSVKENPSNIGGALDERNPDFLKFEF